MRILNYHIDYVADTLWKQMRGLMFSQPKSILFKFKSRKKWEFWMLFVNFPLRILFLDDNYNVSEEQIAIPLTLNPGTWKIYKPQMPCRYVIEIPVRGKDESKAICRD